MSSVNNGGPAFPLNNFGSQTLGMHISGMTLRDYFAAKAINGLVAGPRTWHPAADHKHMAEMAYSIADAMLRARGASE